MKYPKLDDRRYEQLREELIRRIPMHSPQWTDHGPGDPGIALLELFAHLGERLIEEINDVPRRAHQEFLQLLGLPMGPAQAARGMVRLTLPKGTASPVLVQSSPTLEAVAVKADDVSFQIRNEIQVLPVEARPIVKIPRHLAWDELAGTETLAATLQTSWGLSLLEIADSSSDSALENLVAPYERVELPPIEDGRLPPLTDLATTVDGVLWIALLAREGLDLPMDALRRELSQTTINIAVGVDTELHSLDDHERRPQLSDEEPDQIVWQIATGQLKPGDDHALNRLVFDRLVVLDDDTRGLTRTGIVRLRLPSEERIGRWHFDDEEGFEDDPTALEAELRGVGPAPPAFDDEELHDRVITWLRVFTRKAPHPRLRWLDVNTTAVVQSETAPRQVLGIGNGQAHQEFALGYEQILPESVELQVRLHQERWTSFERVDNLLGSGPDDRHFVLDAPNGIVRFGDGTHGYAPRAGEAVRLLTLRHTSGESGNVAPGAIDSVAHSRSADEGRLQVTNLLATSGGADAETFVQARRRLPATLRHRERAVAAQDFRDLTLETPGVDVGRVEVLPRFHPIERLDEVPGVVTLVVLPAYDPLRPDTPTPDREMLRRVCAHLEPRRLVTTELFVTPPEWVEVWISVGITIEPDYGVETVQNWVDLAIRQYLAPLPPYGPTGRGWPMGRALRTPDIQAAVLQVEGVRLVEEVNLVVAADQPQRLTAAGGGIEVLLERWELPVVRNVAVGIGQAPPPSRDGDPRRPAGEVLFDPEGEDLPVPVPVEVEEC